MKEPEKRRSARLILLDDQGCILLFRHARKSGGSFWAPPGGGVENGETFEQAALREAWEELGLSRITLRFLWENTTEFFHIDSPVRQQERFFLVESAVQNLVADVADTHAREGILETRWWTVAELQETTEPVFPEYLTAKLSGIAN